MARDDDAPAATGATDVQVGDQNRAQRNPDMRAAALALAARGMHVLPVREGTKDRPLIRWRHGDEPATTDPNVITRWWSRWPRASVAVATGPSGLVVVDLDGPEGMATWKALTAEYGDVSTAAVATGRDGGGRHLWFLAPAGHVVRNSARRIGPGVDVRGDGGYVLAPPSLHPSGRRYTWAAPGPLAQLPEWVRALAAAPDPRPAVAGTPRRYYGTSPAVADRIVGGLVDVVLDAVEGTRNNRLFWAACRVAEHATAGRIDLADAIDALLRAAEHVGLPTREAERTIRSALQLTPGVPV